MKEKPNPNKIFRRQGGVVGDARKRIEGQKWVREYILFEGHVIHADNKPIKYPKQISEEVENKANYNG